MQDYTVTWQSREHVPSIPVGLLFAGRPEGDAQAFRTPVIHWGEKRACVFDDRKDKQLAWLIVYGDGKHVSGGHPLRGFRHISDIGLSPEGNLYLQDANGQRVEITRQLLGYLSGNQRPGDEREGLLLGTAFYLSNGREKLVANEKGVHAAANPDAMDGRWLFHRGQLIHSASRQVLGVGARLMPANVQTDTWHLSPEGVLSYGDGAQALVTGPDNGQLRLQAQNALIDTRWEISWIPQVPRGKAENLLIRRLEIVVQVAGEPQTWVDGTAEVSINGNRIRTLLAERIYCGRDLRVPVDLPGTFLGQSVFVDDLHSVQIFHANAKEGGQAWRMRSLTLEVNGVMNNRVLGSESPWLLPGEAPCWSAKVDWLSWRLNHADTPLDYAGYTFATAWRSMLKSWLPWRSHEPSDIDGVCQLIGVSNGRILAYDLMRELPVHLPTTGEQDVYTWAFTPQGSILIKHWHEALSRDLFFQHRRLEASDPVVCAGELRIKRVTPHVVMHDLLCMINDEDAMAYQPDGGACLVHVLERFAQLGFETTRTHVHSRDSVPDSPAGQ